MINLAGVRDLQGLGGWLNDIKWIYLKGGWEQLKTGVERGLNRRIWGGVDCVYSVNWGYVVRNCRDISWRL